MSTLTTTAASSPKAPTTAKKKKTRKTKDSFAAVSPTGMKTLIPMSVNASATLPVAAFAAVDALSSPRHARAAPPVEMTVAVLALDAWSNGSAARMALASMRLLGRAALAARYAAAAAAAAATNAEALARLCKRCQKKQTFFFETLFALKNEKA